jgi:hypothetical protein
MSGESPSTSCAARAGGCILREVLIALSMAFLVSAACRAVEAWWAFEDSQRPGAGTEFLFRTEMTAAGFALAAWLVYPRRRPPRPPLDDVTPRLGFLRIVNFGFLCFALWYAFARIREWNVLTHLPPMADPWITRLENAAFAGGAFALAAWWLLRAAMRIGTPGAAENPARRVRTAAQRDWRRVFIFAALVLLACAVSMWPAAVHRAGTSPDQADILNDPWWHVLVALFAVWLAATTVPWPPRWRAATLLPSLENAPHMDSPVFTAVMLGFTALFSGWWPAIPVILFLFFDSARRHKEVLRDKDGDPWLST